jgi:hypothetical protein
MVPWVVDFRVQLTPAKKNVGQFESLMPTDGMIAAVFPHGDVAHPISRAAHEY